ncbi:acyl carrier protein [Streptomyces enissocaesilis]|uniref:Carrier domain-containing protein n=1 Tax=Streptomyces enissocaesilis TaxID=332589 RepID=A0ABN3X6A3_9ACTN
MSTDDQVLFKGVVAAIRQAKEMGGDAGTEVGMTSRLDEDLEMDSLDHVAMLVAIEENFGVIASDEDFAMNSIRTVADVVEVVRGLTRAAQD